MTDEILCFYCDGGTATRVCAACQARIKATTSAAQRAQRDDTPQLEVSE